MINRYDDFEVVVTKQGDKIYADLGNAPDDRHLTHPIDITLPDDRIAWIEACQGRKSEDELAELGHHLFEAIITGELANNWYACLGAVRQQPTTGLRLRFSTQADALTQVPLELLCEKQGTTDEFLVLDSATPIVRSPRCGDSTKERPLMLPSRMLVVIANPCLQVQVDPVAEQASIEEALAECIESRSLIIDYLGLPGYPNADYDTFHHALVQTDHPYDIVHFIGHGDLPDADGKEAEGILLFVDPTTGRRQDVRATDLASVLAYSGVRLVVLQACRGACDGTKNAFQGVAQQLVAKGLPAVVAMQSALEKEVASWFCREFYNFCLTENRLSIERAVTESRCSVRHRFGDQTSAWWTPVLFIRQPSTEVLRKLDEPPFRVQLRRGGIYLERGQVDEAVAELEQAYRFVPDETRPSLARALVAQAQMREGEGADGAALVACERALQVSPDDYVAREIRASIWIRLGDAALEQDDLDEALKAYRQAGDQQRLSRVNERIRRDALERKAISSEQAGQWGKVAELYRQLVREAEDDQEPRARWQKALERVERRLEAEPVEVASASWPPGYILDAAVGGHYQKYEIIEVVATTERCEIYKAKELLYDRRTVAVKRLRPGMLDDRDARERFEREVAVLGRMIGRKSVLQLLYDGKTEDGDRYCVTEFADRGSLKYHLQSIPDSKLNIVEALAIAEAVCQGIDALHRIGVIHRDIKPSNIFLFSQPKGKIRLGDFSIALVPREWVIDDDLTQVGSAIGTFPYLPPEQYEYKKHSVDRRSDLYSWALVFVAMLTSESSLRTFLDNNLGDLIESDEFPPSFFSDKDIPQELVEILRKALRKDPARRYQSARAVLKDLDSIKPLFTADIERYLEAGEEHIKALEWQEAGVAFEQGLELYRWYDEPSELRDRFGELFHRLTAGHLCVRGVLYLAEGQWSAAIQTFGELQEIDPTYPLLDVAEELKRAQLEREFEYKYRRITQLEKQGDWTKILILVPDLEDSYTGPDGESVSDKRKHALYQRGQKLRLDNPELAFHQFYQLYSEDPSYDDVAALCADIAFGNGTRKDIHISWEQRIDWLGKAVELNPNHRVGHTQQQLDEARHRWAEELLKKNHRAAVLQLERISSEYSQWTEVRQDLVQAYDELGQQARNDKEWQDAIEWWRKALKAIRTLPPDVTQNLPPNLQRTLQRRIREARVGYGFEYRKHYIEMIVVVFTVLAGFVGVWQLWGNQLQSGLSSSTPAPSSLILNNGDFGGEFAYWLHNGELDQTVECKGSQCYGVLGKRDYPCADVPVGEAWMKQSIRLPQENSSTLSLRYRIFSYDLDTPDGDYFQIDINGQPLSKRYGNTEWNEASCSREPWDSGWLTLTLDLSAYRGEEVEVSFHNVSTDPYYNTWTYVDDVRIDVN